MLHLALQRLVGYSFVLHTGCLPLLKLTQKIEIPTRACRLTVAGLLFILVVNGVGVRRATYIYLCLDFKERGQKLGYKYLIYYQGFSRKLN